MSWPPMTSRPLCTGCLISPYSLITRGTPRRGPGLRRGGRPARVPVRRADAIVDLVPKDARRPLRVGACLSLTGRFSQFGQQAARALSVWASLDGRAVVLVEDDKSEVQELKATLPRVAARSDLVLGPYSTLLMRVAGDLAAAGDWLIWNHGGSGDDVETSHPGHVVSILTPTSRYAEPFIDHLAAREKPLPELRICYGKGKFGRQVASGAGAYARRAGFERVIAGSAETVLSGELPQGWVLLTAGTFEDDIATLAHARGLDQPAALTCAVAAGVAEFAEAAGDPDGTFGIAQWFPGSGKPARLGPGENAFLGAYHAAAGEPPGYPAVQALAGAVLAAHCARQTGSTDRGLLWRFVAQLDTATLFGPFKIDHASGAQQAHQTVLVRWTGRRQTALWSHGNGPDR